jgi:perosamine synthetase
MVVDSQNMIPHNRPSLGQEEVKVTESIVLSNQLVSAKNIFHFENEICDFIGLPHGHAVAVSTGSAALFLALTALNSKKVAIPSYVCHSLKQATKLAKAEYDILDTKENTTIICPIALAKSQADTLIYPYLFGQTSELPNFSGHIIEDIAQALGASINGKALGTIADIGVLSFYATKLITSGGQGGMVVSKNKDYIDAIRNYLAFDTNADGQEHFNFPLTEIQAAIGRVQLRKLPLFIDKRALIYQIYQRANLPLLNGSINSGEEFISVRYRAVLITPRAKALIAHLAEHNISAIVPIEDWELLAATKNAIKLANNTVSLPIYPTLTLREAEEVAMLCQNFLR